MVQVIHVIDESSIDESINIFYVFPAGGLNASYVQQTIEQVQPFELDLCTELELIKN